MNFCLIGGKGCRLVTSCCMSIKGFFLGGGVCVFCGRGSGFHLPVRQD